MKTYEDIESGFPTVEQLLEVPVEECGEPMVVLPSGGPLVLSFHNSADMIPLVGQVMCVRQRVFDMLGEASRDLRSIRDTFRLKVFYAYRAFEVQQRYFDGIYQRTKTEYPSEDEMFWRNMTHRLIAYPEVAGHPTGGAVDVTITDVHTSKDLDMGVGVRREEFTQAGRRIYTFSPEIDDATLLHRMLLRDVMTRVGFTPFDGEFWHFSYGDREWAYQTGAEKAIYTQIPKSQLQVGM